MNDLVTGLTTGDFFVIIGAFVTVCGFCLKQALRINNLETDIARLRQKQEELEIMLEKTGQAIEHLRQDVSSQIDKFRLSVRDDLDGVRGAVERTSAQLSNQINGILTTLVQNGRH